MIERDTAVRLIRGVVSPAFAGWVTAPLERQPLAEALPALCWRAQIALLFSRFFRWSARSDVALLVLCLHLLGVGTAQLQEMFGWNGAKLSRSFLRVRSRYAGQPIQPCPDGVELIAFWREAEQDQWFAQRLSWHTAQCAICDTALRMSQAVDRARLRRSPSPDKRIPRRQFRFRRSMLTLWFLGLLLLSQVPSRGVWENTPRQPALEGVQAEGPVLWLGSAGPYSVSFDLTQRAWRPVTTRFPPDAGAYRLLSPSGNWIAAWTSDPPREPNWLEIVRPDGSRVVRWRWDRRTNRRPLAWLTDSVLLVRETPVRQAYEREAEYFVRLSREARLLAIEVPSGREHVLLQEVMTTVIPAPDGSVLAVVRPLEPFGSGATNWSVDLVALGETADSRHLTQVTEVIVHDGFPPVWLPDGRALILARRADLDTRTLPTPVELVLLFQDGSMRRVVPHRSGTDLRPLAVAPSGQELLALAVPLGGSDRAALWRVRIADAAVQEIAQLDHLAGPLTVQWQGGVPLIIVVRSLPVGSGLGYGVEVTEIYEVRDKGLQLLGSVPGRWGFDGWGHQLVTILPTLTGPATFSIHPPRGNLGLGPLRISPGQHWILAPLSGGSLALWDGRTGQQLSEVWPFVEASWHPAGMGFLAVTADHRLVLVARTVDGLWVVDPLQPGPASEELWEVVEPLSSSRGS